MSSTNNTSEHPLFPSGAELADLLPDFLNGHLGPAHHKHVESALTADPHLRAQLVAQSLVQQALRADAAVNDARANAVSSSRGSGFDAIAHEIENSRGSRSLFRYLDWWNLGSLRAGAPLAALLLAFGMFAIGDLAPPNVENNEFQTKFGAEEFSRSTLHIKPRIDTRSLEFIELLRDHNLQLGQLLPESNIAEVTPVVEGADIERIVRALSDDERVQLAKVVSAPSEGAVNRVER